jgi:hypothetical protein
MKKLTLLLVFFTIYSFSQDNLTLGLTQDLRLATSKDEAGNKPFTPDLIINFDWEMAQFDSFYPSIKLQYEYANLHGGTFTKYTFSGGLTWCEVSAFGYDYPNLEIGLFLGVGSLDRPTLPMLPSMGVYSVILEGSYEFFRGVRGVVKFELNNAPDLNYLYEDNTTRKNISVGVEFSLFEVD